MKQHEVVIAGHCSHCLEKNTHETWCPEYIAVKDINDLRLAQAEARAKADLAIAEAKMQAGLAQAEREWIHANERINVENEVCEFPLMFMRQIPKPDFSHTNYPIAATGLLAVLFYMVFYFIWISGFILLYLGHWVMGMFVLTIACLDLFYSGKKFYRINTAIKRHEIQKIFKK